MKNIILCGFMGSGKTTLAKGLSEALGMPLIDTDEEIVRRQGRAVADIFASDGEAFFRELETELIKELSENPARLHDMEKNAAALGTVNAADVIVSQIIDLINGK